MNTTQLLLALRGKGWALATALPLALPFVTLALTTYTPAVMAQNVIEDVSVAKGAAGRTTLTFTLKDALPAAPLATETSSITFCATTAGE